MLMTCQYLTSGDQFGQIKASCERDSTSQIRVVLFVLKPSHNEHVARSHTKNKKKEKIQEMDGRYS